MSQNNLIYGLNQVVVAPGSLGIGTIKDEGKVRVVITGAGPSNLVRVRARLVGQQAWTNLVDLTGNVNELVDVLAYDELEINCLVFDTIDGYGFRIVASSFDAGTLFLKTPDGILDGADQINFISSDNTVNISANELTGEIDFRVTGTGTASPAFSDDFLVGDWALVSGMYELEFLASNHLKGANPTVQVFEEISGIFEQVETIIEMNTSGDVKILVSQVPDLRFSGKIIIS